MSHLFKKIQTKLVLLNLLVFGVIQVAVSALIIGLRARELAKSFDRQLLHVATRDCSTVQPGLTFAKLTPNEPVEEQYPIFGEHFLEIRSHDGTPVYRSANLADHDIPLDPATRELAKRALIFETVRGG